MCGAHSVHMARVAKEVGVQREALGAGLIRELLAALLRGEEKRGVRSAVEPLQRKIQQNKSSAVTYLAVVALKVVVLVHRHDPEDLLAALKHQPEDGIRGGGQQSD